MILPIFGPFIFPSTATRFPVSAERNKIIPTAQWSMFIEILYIGQWAMLVCCKRIMKFEKHVYFCFKKFKLMSCFVFVYHIKLTFKRGMNVFPPLSVTLTLCQRDGDDHAVSCPHPETVPTNQQGRDPHKWEAQLAGTLNPEPWTAC